jgi:hypothetical protein
MARASIIHPEPGRIIFGSYSEYGCQEMRLFLSPLGYRAFFEDFGMSYREERMKLLMISGRSRGVRMALEWTKVFSADNLPLHKI